MGDTQYTLQLTFAGLNWVKRAVDGNRKFIWSDQTALYCNRHGQTGQPVKIKCLATRHTQDTQQHTTT